MARVCSTVTLATLLLAAGTAIASAQPADPYGPPPPAPAPPTPAPAPTPPSDQPSIQDPALAEQVAGSLVARAQELYDARELRDAKQLAVETIVTSPHGPAADKARAMIHAINQQLGIAEEQPQPQPQPLPLPPVQPLPPPAQPGEDPSKLSKVVGPADNPRHGARLAAQVHTGIYLGLVGATIGTAFSDDNQAAGAVALGAVGAAGGAVFVAPLLDKHLDEAQIRTIGSGTVWGGVIGGLIADIGVSSGSDVDQTSARQAMIGASIGATVGGLGGYALARQNKLTRGDVALVDTLAAIGTFGGLTLGMVMQPAQTEAYDLNAVLGAAGGVIAGLVAAPSTNTTPRRMVRVAEYAAVGGAAPFLLYAAIYDPNSSADERVIGALSTIGMVGGLVLGLHATAHWDAGMDKLDDGAHDAPPAVIGRTSDGHWDVGAPALTPLSPQLDNHQHGMALTLGSARF